MSGPFLQMGMRDPAVKFLREAVWDLGCIGPDNPWWYSEEAVLKGLKGPTDPAGKGAWADTDVYDWFLKESIKYFQSTHESYLPITLGTPLDVDGKTGKDTWNTLELALKQLEPKPDITAERVTVTKEMQVGDKIIFTWNKYVGVKEKPKGSNRGQPEIDKFIHFTGKSPKIQGPAWCDASGSEIEKEATGEYPLKYLWRCYDTMQYAKKKGVWIPKEDVLSGKRKLRIGVRWIMQYGGGRGHTGHVAFIVYNDKGIPIGIYTREGNYSDSVGISYRLLSQATLVGFCDFLPENDCSVGEKGRNIKLSTGSEKTT